MAAGSAADRRQPPAGDADQHRSATSDADQHWPATSDADQRWQSGDDYDELTRRVQLRNAELVATLHPHPERVASAYDIGCGTGALTATLVRRLPAAVIDGVDVSADMLAAAARKNWPERVRFAQGSFPDTAPPRRTYDAIFSNAALHWTYPRYGEVFATMHRLLAPDGLVCAATAGRTRATELFGQRMRGALAELPGWPDADDFDARRLTADDVAGLARAAGFLVEDVFVVERSFGVAADSYARWWVASGGPWTARQVSADAAAQRLTSALGGPDAEVEFVHASVLMRLRRRDGQARDRQGQEGRGDA